MVLSVFAPLRLCIYAARHNDRFHPSGYIQWNWGGGTPGGAAFVGFGFGWHSSTPEDYLGTFRALSFGSTPVGGQVFWSDTGTHGGAIGFYFGAPGAAFVKECYQFLNPSAPSVNCN